MKYYKILDVRRITFLSEIKLFIIRYSVHLEKLHHSFPRAETIFTCSVLYLFFLFFVKM